MKKIFEFILDKKFIVLGILCALLLACTFKTQVVILKYGDDYALRMEYSIFGSCVRASASLKATEPAVYNEVYFGGSIDETVKKAVKQMAKLSDEDEIVGIMSSGFPRNNDKLEKKLEKMLVSEGYDVEILDVSLSDVLKK